MGKLTPAMEVACALALLISSSAFADAVDGAAANVGANVDAQPAASGAEIWPRVRASLFGTRPIAEDAQSVIELETPLRAEDAATVPLAIHTHVPPDGKTYVEKIYLLVDHNPSPIAAVFHFTPDSGRADIETRIRIEQYTQVRAVAESSTGELFMSTHFVKAAGGCSAPAGKDAAAAAANAGRIKFRVEEPVATDRPALAQLAISHPNASGLAMDQLTRLYAPAWYVREIKVSYAGRPVLTADIDFSISENPNFRFYFLPRDGGELKAEIIDTKDLRFESAVLIKPQVAAANK